jgi:tetratricopeptide (TPR) repeat protein
VFSNRALAWVGKKEFDKAFTDFDEAIRLDPKDATAFANRASAWADQKEYDNAIKDYDEAIRLESWGHLFVERGSVWVHKKEYGKAIEDYDAAIVSAPEDPVTAWAYNRKAWLLATCPIEEYRDGKQAVELAKKACGLVGWKGASYFESLAAAFAENGHFDEAVKWQNKALDDAEHFKKENGEKGQQRVKMYEGKKPYRDQGD